MVAGTVIVQIPELVHLSGLLDETHTQLHDNGGSRVSGGQVGNGAVAGGLSDFYGNWDYRRKALAERLNVLSGLLVQAADWYTANEDSLAKAADQARGSGGTVPSATDPGPRSASVTALLTKANAEPELLDHLFAGAATGTLPGSARTWQQVQADYDAKYSTIGTPANAPLYKDGWPDGGNRYQCVSWAWFRMRELNYAGPQISLADGEDGGYLAGRLGGTKSTVPKLGAVVSYPGHVMIAESVTKSADGHLHVVVSEMNTDSNWTVANPDEYKASRVLTQASDGSWTDSYGTKRDLTVFNPGYPS